ncbi:cold-shock protein [Mesorhizobium sp. WSM3864]|uniref:cold-shock protein n=1 Tax=Mesorhizobium sp. WSM3864 TaxID=2029404 RepID=UPI002478222A|nr:cold-shock protein [Mesorhizobium sp. WSM3864]
MLQAAGSRGVSEARRLKVTTEESPKGHQVSQVLEVDRETHTRSAGEPAAGTSAQLESEGTVKWYNAQKGFGFLAPQNREKDIFVHATALTRSGLGTPIEGQKVFVQCGQGQKGPGVRSIRLA